MPDCHAGAGCVIGTTMTISNKVCPNLVGVDIGCGMLAVSIAEKDVDLPKLDDVVNTYVPAGSFSPGNGVLNAYKHPKSTQRRNHVRQPKILLPQAERELL